MSACSVHTHTHVCTYVRIRCEYPQYIHPDALVHPTPSPGASPHAYNLPPVRPPGGPPMGGHPPGMVGPPPGMGGPPPGMGGPPPGMPPGMPPPMGEL